MEVTKTNDKNFLPILTKLEAAGVTLNHNKCEFYKVSIKFLGHVIDKDGIRADPSKTQAIVQMEASQSVTDLRKFMGVVNQLGKVSQWRIQGSNKVVPDKNYANTKDKCSV